MAKSSDQKKAQRAIASLVGGGLTYDEIADKTGLDRTTLWRIAEGKHQPRKVTRKALENAAAAAAKERRKHVREEHAQ